MYKAIYKCEDILPLAGNITVYVLHVLLIIILIRGGPIFANLTAMYKSLDQIREGEGLFFLEMNNAVFPSLSRPA